MSWRAVALTPCLLLLLLVFAVTAAPVDDLEPGVWLNLGPPEPDPVYGRARGRSWTPKLVVTPVGLCLIGAGGHGRVNQQGFYQDDVSCYDVDAHQWVTLFPGSPVATLLLELDSVTGFEVDIDTGMPTPVAQWGHGYNLCTYAKSHGEIFCLPTTDPSGSQVMPQRYDWLPEGSTQYSGTAPYSAPWRVNVTTRVWDRDKPEVEGEWDREESVVEYVAWKDRVLHLRHGQIWWYDLDAKTWTASVAPVWSFTGGYDHLTCYHASDKKLYVGKIENFAAFDTVTETWEVLSTDVWVSSGVGGNMTCDTKNGVVLLNVYDRSRTPSVRAFDIVTKTWGPELDTPEVEEATYRPLMNCAYAAEHDAHLCVAAPDSMPADPFETDPIQQSRVWGYRYTVPAVSNGPRNLRIQ